MIRVFRMMLHFNWACVFGLCVAARVTAQSYTVFRPQGYSSLEPLDSGRGPDPIHLVHHLTQVQVESDQCEGVNDVLAVTLAAPIVGDIAPEQFGLMHCPLFEKTDDSDYVYWTPDWDGCVSSRPACAQLQLEDEPKERRTVLLFGQFIEFEGQKAIHTLIQSSLKDVTFVVNGTQLSAYGENISGQGFGVGLPLGPEEPVLGYGHGPFLADISLLNLTAPINTAAGDPIGCAALHPSATYAVRLLFASAVHERAADGGLAPFGTNATAATALFSVRTDNKAETLSPDKVVGVAHAPGGSVVDVCIEAAAEEPQVEAVVINCTAAAPLSPAGFPCTIPIKAFLRAWEDARIGRDPTTFAGGNTIEFCLAGAENCPGYVPEPSEESDNSNNEVDGGDDDGGEPSGQVVSDVRSLNSGAGAVVAAVAIMASMAVAGYV